MGRNPQQLTFAYPDTEDHREMEEGTKVKEESLQL